MASPRVIVIGAGMSGLLMGIKLREAGIESFEILEQADAVGGTWRDNTYPGLLCDVPAHTYTYSFEPNPRWQRLYAAGPEIRDYFEHVADKYALRPYIRFNTKVASIAREDGGWTVTTADGRTRRADFVVTCVGGLVHPKYPEIEGLDSFAGTKFHSARWDHSVDLKDKHVGVIGAGSTATQITCALAGQVRHYALFQRTAQWVCPQFDMPRPEWLRWLQRRYPLFAHLCGRLQLFLFEVTFARAVVGSKLMIGLLRFLNRRHLNTVKDPELRRRLTPNYSVGCKRQVFSDAFYDAIQRPNTELVTEGIARVEPDGIVTRDGRLHALDVLVFATGFHALDYMRHMAILGEGGRNLGEAWAEGAKAHRSVALPGFPNFFMIIGPHSPVGNYSLIDISEYQVGYIMTFIRLFQQGRCATVEPRLDAMQHYNAVVRDGLKNTVWTSGCVSWYLDRSGLPNVYPFTPSRFRREMKQPELEEFTLTG